MDVSIIIPTYNRLWALPKTIESCRHTICQTEIIVVDDGSTDGTWDWLQTQTDVVALQQQNWGKCWAVNKASEIAKGKYVKFLDSDDSIAANTIDEQFNLAEANNSDIVVSGYLLADENNQVIKQQPWVYCDDYIAQQLGECDSSHYSAYLFNRQFVADVPHRPDFAYRDDRLFVLETALKNPIVTIHPGLALVHIMHTKPKMQRTTGIQKTTQNYQHLGVYKKIFAMLAAKNQLTKRRIKASQNVLWALCKWIAYDNIDEAKSLLKWMHDLDPEFKIPLQKPIDRVYRKFGFGLVNRLLKLKRLISI